MEFHFPFLSPGVCPSTCLNKIYPTSYLDAWGSSQATLPGLLCLDEMLMRHPGKMVT
jgi:hypothetical protein